MLLLGLRPLPELRQRYAREDEDVRCAILAAVPELDPAGGVAWLGSGGGARDKNKACQHLALRRMGRTRVVARRKVAGAGVDSTSHRRIQGKVSRLRRAGEKARGSKCHSC